MSAAAKGNSSIATSSRHTLEDDPSTDLHIELLTEHFGFNPRVFIDALVYVANEHLYSIGAQFEKFVRDQLRKQYSKKEGSDKSIKALADSQAEKGAHAILTLLENALDHTFDVLELYCLKAVFGVRPSQARLITLQHHRGLDLRSTEDRIRNGEMTNAISSEEESIELQKRQDELIASIRRARKLRHALILANLAAQRNLSRAQRLTARFAVILSGEDGNIQIPSILPQSARKLTLDASSLLKSMTHLTEMDPLGSEMLSPSDSTASEDQRGRVLSENGVSEAEQKSWKGREGYIQWETNRIMNNVRQRRVSDIGNLTARSVSSVKRRKTEDHVADPESLGAVSDLQDLAEILKQ